MFGSAFFEGKQHNIGQHLLDFSEHLRYVAPMEYPSHWDCMSFGLADPNLHPYEVYKFSIAGGISQLKKVGKTMILRPWIQAFHIRNIYYNNPESPCVKKGIATATINYGRHMFREQIRALQEFPEYAGWMAWNPNGAYPKELFEPKKRP